MTTIVVRPRVGGFFKMEARKLDGSVRPLTGWFPNLVTDVGLNRIGQGSYLNACHVGTNNTAPANSNTSLAGYVAGTTTSVSGSNGAQATAPYYGWKRKTFRFGIGAATGNLSEVGVATAAANGGSTVLFSRALILDEFGDPTTVTVLADEILDVTYELRLYPPLTDTTQTVSITGSGSHDLITRAASVTSDRWGYFLGSVLSFDPSGGTSMRAHSGEIGAITGAPSGTTSSSGTCYNIAYGNNNLYRDGGANFSLSQGNVGGIRSVSWYTTHGYFQTRFDPVINKTATKTLNLIFRVAWARNV
jgi:hypothetical protein